MLRLRTVLSSFAVAAAVTSCSPAQLAALSPEAAARITGLCQQAQPLLGLARLVPSATAHEVAGFVNAYCGEMLAGSVPTTTDGNTEPWLRTNIAGLRALLGR